jgi:hypothetical protein
MPIDLDIMDHEVIGPWIRQGMEQGRAQATREIVRRQIEKRFGPIPAWAEQRLIESSPSATEDLAMKVIDAPTLEELFR